MNLPVPNQQQVEKFAALYERKFGVVLTAEEAWEAATRTLQLVYLVTYGGRTKRPAANPSNPGTH